MDKLKYIKIKQEDGTYSEEVPVGVDASNVDMSDGRTLPETLGLIDVDANGTVKQQLDELNKNKVDKNDFNNTISELNNNINQKVNHSDYIIKVSELENENNVQNSRIDSFLSLPEGSTTGDAALNDIKIGYDGIEYDSPGNAVRKQVKTLSKEKADQLVYEKFFSENASNSYYSFTFKKNHTYLIKNNSDNAGCNISSIKTESDRVLVEEIVKNFAAGKQTFFTASKDALGIYIYSSGASVIEINDITIEKEYNKSFGAITVFNVNYYGILPQNEDNTDLFIKMLNILPKNINIKLFFPKGTYNFIKGNKRLILPSRCSIIGDEATIFFDDIEEKKGVSLFQPGSEYLCFDGINFLSNFDKIKNSNNAVYLLYGSGCNNIIIRNCTFKYFRTICMNVENCLNVLIENNKFEYMSRDCNRFINTKSSIVRNNIFDHCGDDIVAFTQMSQTLFSDKGHEFYNNRITYSMGVCYLGCSNVKIYNNKFIRYMYIGKFGQSPILESEGGISYNIIISNNLFLNPIYCNEIGQGRFSCRADEVNHLKFINNTFLKNENIQTIETIIFIESWFNNVKCDNYLTLIACPNDTNDYFEFIGNYMNDPFNSEVNCRLITGNIPSHLNLINNHFTQMKAIPLNINYKQGKVINNYFGFNTSGISQAFLGNPTINKNNIYAGIAGYQGDNENYVLNQSGTTISSNLNNIKVNESYICESYKKTKSVSIPTQGYYFKGDIVYNTSDNNILCWKRLTDGDNHVLGIDWKEISYD